MRSQKSFKEQNATLFLVTTPIGNLSDMTPRAVETLKNVALIASEDTRVTKKLCTHFSIATPLMSYHEHNKHQKNAGILDRLGQGEDVALVSDAGMPLISDPGDTLVEEVLNAGFAVVPIPGANAALTALVASGLTAQPFLFYGFLERQKSKKTKELEGLKSLKATLIFYESPHRIKETLTDMLAVFGNRSAVVARELTKVYEEFFRGDIESLLDNLEQIKGEVVLLVEGTTDELAVHVWWEGLSLEAHVNHYVNEGKKTNDAIKAVAADLNVPKQVVYKEYHHD